MALKEKAPKREGKIPEGILPIVQSASRKAKRKYCRKLIFRGELYTVSDYVLLRETKTSNMVGILRRIIKEGGDPLHPKLPMLEIEWCEPH